MLVRALQTRGVYACHCQVESDRIKVGILVAEEGITGQVSLAQTDNPKGDRFLVELPSLTTIPAYNIELTRYGDFISNPKAA